MAGYKRGYSAAGGGASTVAWNALTGLTLGGMDTLDDYITAVVDNGDGDYTFTYDIAQNRTNPGNADFYRFDLITEWASLDPKLYALEFRITVVSRPTDTTGNPYITLFHDNGSGVKRTGGVNLVSVVFDSDANDDWSRALSLYSNLIESATLGEISADYSIVFRLTPWFGNISQYGNDCEIYDAAGALVHKFSRINSSVDTPSTDEIDAGYDVASGSHMGLGFQQLGPTGTGSETFRVKFEYRFVPLPIADS